MKLAAASALVLLALLIAGAVPAVGGVHPLPVSNPVFKDVPTQICACKPVPQGLGREAAALLPPERLAPTPVYDEQLGATFTQSFTSMAFNVTATEQTDSGSGDGPAYLLNGVSNAGYWYQVGLSWNWNPGTTPGTGFDMVYEVFDPQQRSIFPIDGSGGLRTFSGTVDQGDSVLLNLYFNSSQVVMLAHDWNTGASASETYSARTATFFQGDPANNANSNGFFTGLMTEWYHEQPFLSNEKEVVYLQSGLAVSSAWLWMDEYNPNTTPPTSVFANSTASPLNFVAEPSKLQEFSSNGATEYMDASEFVTGAMNVTAPSTVPLTLSYSILGSGTGLPTPVLHYVSSGAHVNATLSTSAVTYKLDLGSPWFIDNPLTGSTASERWQSDQQMNGSAVSATVIALTYYQQYTATVSYAVVGQATGAPTFSYTTFGASEKVTASDTPTTLWVDAGSDYAMTNPVGSSNSNERWLSMDPVNGTIHSSITLAPTYFQQFLVEARYSIIGGGSFFPAISGVSFGSPITNPLTTGGSTSWLDSGSPYSLVILGNGPGMETNASAQRWTTNATSGTVTLDLDIDAQYQHQYLVALQPSVPAAGSVSTPGGWYDAGSQLQVTASTNNGWKLEYWRTVTSLSQVVSANGTLSVQVNGPVNDTAVFYPGLTISAGPEVSVSYSYPSGITSSVTVQGTVPAGTSEVVYVPQGGVTLSASPSSFLYSFGGWSGTSSSRAASISAAISNPGTISAQSTYNFLDIGIILGAVILLVVIVAALAASRSRKTVGSPTA